MEEEVKEKSKVDYIPIVRAMIKLSSALSDADDVADGKYYKYKFKVELAKWIEKTEKATKPFMDNFNNNSEKALQEASDRFYEFSDDIVVGNPDRTSLVLLYCKCQSAMNDMQPMSFDEGGMIVHILIKYTDNMLTALKGQYGDIFDIRDSEDRSIQSVIDGYDDLGNKMFIKK
jgi:hypothetical protein